MSLRSMAYVGMAGAAVLFGQLAGPGSGLVFDPATRSVRWIVGVPGAAYLGSAAASELGAGAVSPDGRWVVAARNGGLSLARVGAAELSWATLEETAAVESVTWSADSSAVAVTGRGLRVWRNLAEQPVRAGLTEGAQWLAIVVEPQGEGVLAAAQGGIYRLTGGEARLVAAVEQPGGLALNAEGVLFAGDRGGRQVLSIRNWKESPEVARVAGGIDDPVALAANGPRLLVAGARTLTELDAATGAPVRSWQLDFEPSRVESVGPGLYALNRRTAEGEPLQVLTAGKEGAVVFIPGGRE